MLKYLNITSLSPELVPEPEQQQAPLQAGDESLSDQLLEALGVELPAHLADSLRSGNKQGTRYGIELNDLKCCLNPI